MDNGARSASRNLRPRPLLLHGAFSTTRRYFPKTASASSADRHSKASPTVLFFLKRGSRLTDVRRCDSCRIASICSSEGSSCSPTPCLFNAAHRALFHPQGCMLFALSKKTLCFHGRNKLFPRRKQSVSTAETIDKRRLTDWRKRLKEVSASPVSSTRTTSPSFAQSAGRNPRSWRNWRPAWGAVKLLRFAARAISCSGLKICSVMAFKTYSRSGR